MPPASPAPKWRKSPQALIDLFEKVTPPPPAAEHRKMFGYPACFANGNMFAGLHQESMVLRRSEDDLTDFRRATGATAFEPMPGRPMRGYAVVPPELLDSPTALRAWVAKALAFARSLPPKAASPTTAAPSPTRGRDAPAISRGPKAVG